MLVLYRISKGPVLLYFLYFCGKKNHLFGLSPLYTAPVPECLWLCVVHHLVCGGLAGDLVPWLQGAPTGSRGWKRWGQNGKKNVSSWLNKNLFPLYNSFPSLTTAYLAVVNAACERAPMIYPRAVSDGQFYSPPESVAGDPCLLTRISAKVCVHFLFNLQTDFWPWTCVCRLWWGSGRGGSWTQSCHCSSTVSVFTAVTLSFLLLMMMTLILHLHSSCFRRKSMSDRAVRPCQWSNRSWPRRTTGNSKKTM